MYRQDSNLVLNDILRELSEVHKLLKMISDRMLPITYTYTAKWVDGCQHSYYDEETTGGKFFVCHKCGQRIPTTGI